MLRCIVTILLATVHENPIHTWTEHAAGPGTRYAQTLLWDTVGKRAVLYGGERNTDEGKAEAILGDAWLYDPEHDAWEQVKTKGRKPDARAYQAATIDCAGRKLYVHGGFDTQFRFRDDLWVLDLDKHVWTELAPAGEKPGVRDAHSLHFDEQKQALYLVGGLLDFAKFRSSKETWIFDIASGVWKRGPDAPANVFLHGAMFDPKERCVLTWGGSDAPDQNVHAWNVDKGAWTKLGSGPPVSIGMGSAFDPKSRRWFLACGSDGSGCSGVLYAYDLEKKKVEKLANDKRIARGYTAACLDPETGSLMLCGGTQGAFTAPCVPDGMWSLATRK